LVDRLNSESWRDATESCNGCSFTPDADVHVPYSASAKLRKTVRRKRTDPEILTHHENTLH
jgi:hypothetical protein